ncbi:MAG: glutamate synthase large subunit [Candidatus Omnitrophota bacterium]|jgi:glutamate synthase domain-containing protein 2/glutamate synthase domain-containing protein 1/glutamate synthase domain-containing protein 3|nr:MAG: glutamate synthase large subunit [Candidatus Omnitrophota bacterium]
MSFAHLPKEQGLYDPRFEHDACGVGFVCNVKGEKSNEIISQGLEVLRRLSHRGATGADPDTGDGAGLLIQLPTEFLLEEAKASRIKINNRQFFGIGMIFLPTEKNDYNYCKKVLENEAKRQKLVVLGWRRVPVDNSCIGKTARQTQPVIEQVFIGAPEGITKDEDIVFERKLYITRKLTENAIRGSGIKQKTFFYITNLSCRTLSYKGLLTPGQMDKFFVDLKSKKLKSSLCLVHSRYSTNTFPTWDLSQPFRFLAHNGEINTLRGNINWMRAREGLLKSSEFKSLLKKMLPVIVPDVSDSATIDNVFELLVLSGRSMPHAMLMLIPSAWEHDKLMDAKYRDFYKFHACFMEPWDGPAAIAFTDGTRIGAVLDRNGLRPARYIVTKNDFVVMASEVGVLDIKPKEVLSSGRLEPGKMLFIDTVAGKIIEDRQIKKEISESKPYGKWLKDNIVELNKIKPSLKKEEIDQESVLELMKAFSFSREDLNIIVKPMAETAQEPVGSMGNDTPHAVLSNNAQLLYDYFKQLFAQVTNPAIDPIREELVMSLQSFVGPEKNLLEESPRHCHKLKVEQPILRDEELAKIKNIREKGFKTKVISILFDVDDKNSFRSILEKICAEAAAAIKDGYTFLILSDRGVDRQHAALPALLAVGAVHHHLVRKALRTQIGIIIQTAEAREVHHFALLLGYGADCINPYLCYKAIEGMILAKEINLDTEKAISNYIKAVDKGILKVLSKMGISTLQSYRGAQIFEALGIGRQVIDKCFPGTVSRIGGADFNTIEKEVITRHAQAYRSPQINAPYLSNPGKYQWRKGGEFHLWNPDSIAALQDAVRTNNVNKYREFTELINNQSANPCTLRSLLKFKASSQVPIEKVEPVSEIVRRFVTGAMSFGSISRSTHETIAIAMNRLKGKSNTGEGGEDPVRFIPLPDGDSRRSAIKQVASGRFGVTTNYLINADELQIKIAQGAKPGEGGQLPGHKVSAIIAKTRYTTPGVTLISPPPHHDIYSIEDLAQLIFDLKNANPNARISVKLVSEIGVGTIAAGVAKGHADMILISGGDGGTGASPLSSIKHAGLPWELGLSETHQTLVLNDLRSRLRLQTDGQMRTGRDLAIAAILGAEEFGFCTSALIVLGCVMLRHCHLNNCSVGVATQDEILEKRFNGRPEYLVNYFTFVAEELRQIMSGLGVYRIDEMIGRTELLEADKGIIPWKAKGIDLSKILYKPKTEMDSSIRCTMAQDHGIDNILDLELIKLAEEALTRQKPVSAELPIHNFNRTTGAMLSGQVCKRYGDSGLPEDTINFAFKGTAGQSFGAFLARGITFKLEGMANDYVGKGIFGGKIIIYPDRTVTYDAGSNIIIGNTTFYGAINGQAYIRGIAGERFCIRNSGLSAVVEGVGDHGCEYMTGGIVVVLGRTGMNFAAGMSGGIAYIYDDNVEFKDKCNMSMVELETPGQDDLETISKLLNNHYRYTQSPVARGIMDDFKKKSKNFIKVMPIEYKRIITEEKVIEKKLNLLEVSDG